jgi:hypothetical protein
LWSILVAVERKLVLNSGAKLINVEEEATKKRTLEEEKLKRTNYEAAAGWVLFWNGWCERMAWMRFRMRLLF